MRLPPDEVRAKWPTPNYDSPETRGQALMIVELTILPIAAIILFLRLYVRVFMLRRSGWDDWLMVVAGCFGTGVTVCVILATSRYGWNAHVWDLRLNDLISGRKVSLAAQALFVFATTFAKVSILLSYLRFAPLGSMLRRASLGTIWTLCLANSVFLVVLFTQCNPTSSYWNILKSPSDCISEGPPLLAQATVTVLADFAVWVMPLPTFFQTRLPRSQRIALVTLFSVGLIVVFGACMRLYWIWYVVEKTYDVTWEGFHLWIWTAVEVHLGIICGCIPTLKALLGSYDHASRNGSKPVYIAGSSAKGGRGDGTGDPQSIRLADRQSQQQPGVSTNKSLGEGEGKQLGEPSDRYMDLESCCSDTTTDVRPK